MRIRVKEIRRMHKRKEERWKLLHKGTSVAAAATAKAAASAAAARSAGTRTGAARPARRATAAAEA